MRIVVSACLLGEKCKYNGGDNRNARVIDFVKGHEVIPVCPERAAGMPSPRPPVEIRCGRLVDCHGHDVDTCYRAGVSRTIAMLGDAPVDLAILQPRSPTCGVHQVYDGTFSGRLVPGQGLTAALLRRRGLEVFSEETLDALSRLKDAHSAEHGC